MQAGVIQVIIRSEWTGLSEVYYGHKFSSHYLAVTPLSLFRNSRNRLRQRFCGERYWVFVQEFEVHSSGTVRMFESKSNVFCLSSGTDGKLEGHLIKKPTVSERETLPIISP